MIRFNLKKEVFEEIELSRHFEFSGGFSRGLASFSGRKILIFGGTDSATYDGIKDCFIFDTQDFSIKPTSPLPEELQPEQASHFN